MYNRADATDRTGCSIRNARRRYGAGASAFITGSGAPVGGQTFSRISPNPIHEPRQPTAGSSSTSNQASSLQSERTRFSSHTLTCQVYRRPRASGRPAYPIPADEDDSTRPLSHTRAPSRAGASPRMSRIW
jgi:hypothetical protein